MRNVWKVMNPPEILLQISNFFFSFLDLHNPALDILNVGVDRTFMLTIASCPLISPRFRLFLDSPFPFAFSMHLSLQMTTFMMFFLDTAVAVGSAAALT